MAETVLTMEDIVALAAQSAAVDKRCACAGRVIRGWESVPITFPEELLDKRGQVAPAAEGRNNVAEYHPHGTNYWSEEAPIALAWFPANRCEVAQCRKCARCYLRYTEFGGYYIDRRIRSLSPDLIDLAPLDAD
jgi:hypothetical protein